MSLFDLLIENGITKTEACELFGKSCKTLKRWNDDPPDWVLRIVQLMAKILPFPDCWNHWSFENEWIIDEAGNKYHINDVRNIFWTRQLTQSLTGDKYQVSSLKLHLENKLKLLESEIISSLVNHGEELKSWNVSL